MRRSETALRGGIVVGIGLVLVGIGSAVATDFASVTALIPALFGVVFAALGLVGRRRSGREGEALWGLALLAALGVAGTLRMLPDVVSFVAGASVDSEVATVANGLMALGSLVVALLAASALLASRR